MYSCSPDYMQWGYLWGFRIDMKSDNAIYTIYTIYTISMSFFNILSFSDLSLSILCFKSEQDFPFYTRVWSFTYCIRFCEVFIGEFLKWLLFRVNNKYFMGAPLFKLILNPDSHGQASNREKMKKRIISATVGVLVRGHPRDAKKLSVTGAGRVSE